MTEKRFTFDGKDCFDNGEFWLDLGLPTYSNIREICNMLNELTEENEQLKQDRNALIHLLENQSMIIEELHSKLLEYQLKEPIVLTKEDLNLMDKAISYYTHGRYLE